MRNTLLIFLLLSCVSHADVLGTNDTINFDSNSDTSPELTLNSTGLGIGITPSSNLHVNGNALVESLQIGSATGSANLQVNGTLGVFSQTISSNTTLDEHSMILVDSSSDNITLTLPYAGNVTGRIYHIKKTSISNSVWISGMGNLIDDTNPLELNSSTTSLPSVKIISNGQQWYIIDSTTTPSTVAASNLIGWWKLDESSGIIAKDSSESENDGTLNGSSTFSDNSMSGAIKNGLYFDGNDDYVSLGSTIDFLNGDVWSISFWAIQQGASNEGMIVGDSTQINYFIWFSVGNYFRFYNTSANDFTELTDFSVLAQYVLTSDGSDVSLYKNGSYISSKTIDTSFKVNAIGKAHTNSIFNYKGIIDDVRVYDRALTAAEINILYQQHQ